MERYDTTQSTYAPYHEAHPSSDAAVPPAAPEAFDAADALDRLGGDSEIFCDVVGALLDTQPALFSELERVVARGDLSATTRAAHTLKGALLAVSALPSASLARAIEESARVGAAAPYAQWVDALRAELQRLYSSLQEFVRRAQAA